MMDPETIGKSHVWLFDYYQEMTCRKSFDKYDKCIAKHGNPENCEEENMKCGTCVSGFWSSLNMECRPLIGEESVDESGHFKRDFVEKFDNCLKNIPREDISSSSTLMPPPNPSDDVNLEASLPILGVIFSRRACSTALKSYQKCRKSSGSVHDCVDAGKELTMCNVRFAQAVIPNCMKSVTSFYQAKMAQNEKDAPPSNRELYKEYFNCLSSSQNTSS